MWCFQMAYIWHKHPCWCINISNEEEKTRKKVAKKILWWFPLKSRLQSLLMCAKTTTLMRWHFNSCEDDGWLLKSSSWCLCMQRVWYSYTYFSKDPYEVHLWLASSDFIPFRMASLRHSMELAILVTLTCWHGCAWSNHLLSCLLLIPGPDSPGNNVDIYLQTLIDEFQQLEDGGIETHDTPKSKLFGCMLHWCRLLIIF